MVEITGASGAHPHFRVEACPNTEHAERWLNEVYRDGYRPIIIAPVSKTDHFTKEIGTSIWVIAELEETHTAVVSRTPLSVSPAAAT